MRALCIVAAVGLVGCTSDKPKQNQTPLVTANASATTGPAPLTTTFLAIPSGGDGALAYSWNFGDGSPLDTSGKQVTHVYTTAGHYLAIVTVTDEDGDAAAAVVSVGVTSADLLPTVTAAASTTAGAAPLAIDFTCTTTGGDGTSTFSWSFGDGATAPVGTASHTYGTPGRYTASCTAVDANGSIAIGTVDITVAKNGLPTVTASATPDSGAAPLSVSFVGTALGGDGTVTSKWDFGDGSAVETSDKATHVYAAEGVYNAVYTANDADGDSASGVVKIVVGGPDTVPVVTASGTPTTGPAPLAIAFQCTATSGNGALTYTWDFGDGSSASIPSPSHTYAAAGPHTATCVVTDMNGDRGSATVTATVTPIVVTVSASGTCAAGASLLLTSATDSTRTDLVYEWQALSGAVQFSTPSSPATALISAADGTHTVALTVSDGVNRYRSNPITFTIDTKATLAIVSGSGQNGFVGNPIADPLIARVTNSCGAPLSNVTVAWQAAGATPDATKSTSDATGLVRMSGRFGTTAGPQAITVSSGAASASFPLTGKALGASFVTTLEAAAFPVGTVNQIKFVTVDRYDNPVTGLSFQLNLDLDGVDGTRNGAGADLDTCGSGKTVGTYTGTNGVATVPVCANGFGEVRPQVASTPLPFRARIDLVAQDFEQGWAPFDAPYYLGAAPPNVWELAVPTGVDAHSGTHVYGTAVRRGSVTVGAATPQPSGTAIDVDLTDSGLDDLTDAQLSFWAQYDMPIGDACAPAALVIVNGNPQALPGMEPSSCDANNFVAWRGSSATWVRAEVPLDEWLGDESTVAWAYLYNDVPPVGKKGFYIDDVVVRAHGKYPRLRFGAATAPAVVSLDPIPGVAGCDSDASAAIVLTSVVNADLNPLAVPVTMTVTGDAKFRSTFMVQTFAGVGNISGYTVSPDGKTATFKLENAPTLPPLGFILLSDATAETVTVTAKAGAAETSITVDFLAPSDELANDSRDNDCDGQIDCTDSDIRESEDCEPGFSIVPNETCNGIDDNGDGTIDEMACGCNPAAFTCATLDASFTCQPLLSVCGWDCRVVDICASAGGGLECDTSSGYCLPTPS